MATERKMLKINDYFDQHRAEVAHLLSRVAAIVRETHEITSQTWGEDITANLAALVPELPARVAILASIGEHEAADQIIRDALIALEREDPFLFENTSKAALVKLWSRFTPVQVARGTADRAGVEEARRDGYVLKHKIAAEKTPDREIDSEPAAKNLVRGTLVTDAMAAASLEHAAKAEKPGRRLYSLNRVGGPTVPAGAPADQD